LVDGSAIP